MLAPLNDAAAEVGALLLASTDSALRASTIASAIVDLLPDSACVVHRFVVADGEGEWGPSA
jgi:hypothetical protein